MTQYFARVVDGVVAQVEQIPDGLVIGVDIFASAYAETLVPATAAAAIGQTYADGAFGPAPAPAAPTKAQLLGYANAKQWALAIGGFAVTVEGASHVFATDPTSQTLMYGKLARLAQPSPPATINWQLDADTWLTIAAADFPPIAAACVDFVQATFDALKTVVAAIGAGTITTFAQIDDPTTAALAAWPLNT